MTSSQFERGIHDHLPCNFCQTIPRPLQEHVDIPERTTTLPNASSQNGGEERALHATPNQNV